MLESVLTVTWNAHEGRNGRHVELGITGLGDGCEQLIQCTSSVTYRNFVRAG